MSYYHDKRAFDFRPIEVMETYGGHLYIDDFSSGRVQWFYISESPVWFYCSSRE